MQKASGSIRRSMIPTLLCASALFQFGGCSFGEITTTTTVDGRELLISLVRGAILTPLDQALTQAINDAFSNEG